MNASDAPTRRMISISSARATTASRIVFTMMNSTITPTIARIATPADRTTLVTVVTRSTSASMLSTLRTTGSPRSASATAPRPDGEVELHVDAGVERVRLEVPREVLAALRLLRLAEALQRLLAADELDRRGLGHRLDARDEVVDLVLGRRWSAM